MAPASELPGAPAEGPCPLPTWKATGTGTATGTSVGVSSGPRPPPPAPAACRCIRAARYARRRRPGSHFDGTGICCLAELPAYVWAGAAAALLRGGLIRRLPDGGFAIVDLGALDVVLAGARVGLLGGWALPPPAAARLGEVLPVLAAENGRATALVWQQQRLLCAQDRCGSPGTPQLAELHAALRRVHAAQAVMAAIEEAEWQQLEDPRLQRAA